MLAVYRVILLFVHLLHFKSTQVLTSENITRTTIQTTTERSVKTVPQDVAILDIGDAALPPLLTAATLAPLSKAMVTNQDDDSLTSADTEVVKARILATSMTERTPIGSHKYRTGRQLFLDPGIFLLQKGLGWEGAQCLSSGGMFGICVRIESCRQYYSVARQITFFAVRQWTQPVANDVCSFYDQFGRANSGICCTDVKSNAFGVFPHLPPAVAPSLASESPIQNVDNTGIVSTGEEHEEDSPDFQDITVEADKSQESNANVSNQVVPVVYDDTTRFQYQWPPSFGHFAGLPQWPPAVPTHPPATGGWPPPIPTHPPGHHYPTHPPTVGSGIKPTTNSPTSTQTTKASSSQRPTISTTRRPSYPGYPIYPSYPTYRPITTTTIAPTTTTRRPISNGGALGTTPEGLPLKCGTRNPPSPDQERIVGGINASPHEFPWIAVLFKSGKQFCGGSLITNSHVLTAAHCVARMTSWDVAALTAHLGDYNIRTDFEVKHVERRIKRLVRHKGFDFSTLHNDIAILTLSEPIQYTAEIQPICLPTSASQQSRTYSGQLATVAGWGSLRENGPQPSILQKVEIPIWANQECARKYGRAAPGGIIESMVCAGQAAKDSCSGDSGGPMIVHDGGRYTQVGIVSWGIGCGKGQYPGVYTRVTSLLPWIYKNIKG